MLGFSCAVQSDDDDGDGYDDDVDDMNGVDVTFSSITFQHAYQNRLHLILTIY